MYLVGAKAHSSYKNTRMSKKNIPLVVGNWKMNPQTLEEAYTPFSRVRKGVSPRAGAVEVALCPPALYLVPLTAVKAKGMSWGAQDAFWKSEGAYTGEISPAMLKAAGCKYVIVGHSERKRYLGETHEVIRQKLIAVLEEGLTPILCVGEEEEEHDRVGQILRQQLTHILKDIPKKRIKKLVVAYEPVWALSTSEEGKQSLPSDALSAILFIKKVLIDVLGEKYASHVRLLYGGSVEGSNAEGYLEHGGVEGLLVGGASLDAQEFIKIVKSLS